MMKQNISTNPFDFILFGGVGNLSATKLLPALYHRSRDGELSESTRIIAASRAILSENEFELFCRNSLQKHVEPKYFDEQTFQKFFSSLSYMYVDVQTEEGFDSLKSLLQNGNKNRIFYLAVGPDLFEIVPEKLTKYGMITPETKIVIEKPIGHNFSSAQSVNDVMSRHFLENQIFRIDHYLGKETVQNLLALRFANTLYEPQWNASYIDHIQITVAETIGLEHRVSYYDHAGALRDMVQNHLLQLLCLVTMEPSFSMDSNSIRDEKLKILRCLKPMNPTMVKEQTVRGVYGQGIVNGVALKSYTEELGRDSQTETFVAIKAEIENWRWGGVPFYLRTGKRLANRLSEIVIQFKKIPHSIFAEYTDKIAQNKLVIRLQPDEGIKQFIMLKNPELQGMHLHEVPLDMSFRQSFQGRSPDAYERLLMDVARGTQTLFMRRDEIEAAWMWIDPILETWTKEKQTVFDYTSGSWGPREANLLLQKDGRTWKENTA